MDKINPAGLEIIKLYEGLRLQAYLCPANVLTIGYGHTGPDVKPKMHITAQEAERLLQTDLTEFEEGVISNLGGAKTNENQFSAMVSLAYNIGLTAFKASSVIRHHRDGNTSKAAASFKLLNKGGGKVLPGLTKRRAAEAALYLTPIK